MNRKNLIERIIRSIIKSTELFARIILIFREIIAKESQDRHNFLIIPRRRWREEGRIKSTIYRVFKRFKSVSRFEAHAFTRDACVPGNIRGITRYTHAHTFVQIGVSRVAHCIYYCYYYYFVSFPFVLPPPAPPPFFLRSPRRRNGEKERDRERARERGDRRQTQGRHSSCGNAHVKIRREYFTFRGARAPRRQRRGATSRGIHFEIRIYTLLLRPGSRE